MIQYDVYHDPFVAFIFGVDDALLGAGAGLLGGIVNNVMAGQRQEDAFGQNRDNMLLQGTFNSIEAAKQRDWSADQSTVATERAADMATVAAERNRTGAIEQRDWTKDMASTAYQRTMLDMKKAGLNPMLAYRQGAVGSGPGSVSSAPMASSSMPSGSSASGMAAAHNSASQVFDVIGPAVSNAVSMARLANETKLADAQVEKTRAETETEKRRPGYVEAGTAESGMRYRKGEHEMPEAEATGKRSKLEVDMLENAAYQALIKAGLVTGNSAKVVGDIMSPIPGIAVLKKAFGTQKSERVRQNTSDGFSEFYTSTGR